MKARVAAAISLAGGKGGSFWLGYSFAVRPGILFDTVIVGSGGSRISIDGGAFAPASIGTQNLGIFLLYDSKTRAATRAEVYNLDRPRDYFGYPVYWLGRASGDESLPFLRSLAETMQSYEGARRLVDAIGAHDDPRTIATLQDVVRAVKADRLRTTAVSWLGNSPGQTDFLSALVRNERESVAVRREAAEAVGQSSVPGTVLQTLYRAVSNRDVKAELLEALGERSDDASMAFLIEAFQRESDRRLREEAIEALADMKDERAVDVMAKAYDASRDEWMKDEILEALGETESSRALQKLVAVAKDDPSFKLRRRAIELLGESRDPAALEFLERMLR